MVSPSRFLSIALLVLSSSMAANAANYPDPVLRAAESGPIICSSEDQLKSVQKELIRAVDTKKDPASILVPGCFHLNGTFRVKVLKIDGAFVEVKIPDSSLGDQSAFVFFGALSAPDDKNSTPNYTTTTTTVACRRTTDFAEAMEAVKQLDLQWFSHNPNCRIVEKGVKVQLVASSAPASKVCVGSGDNCFLAWMPTTSFDEVKTAPRVFGRGMLKVCWPPDVDHDDRQSDVRVPSGLIFHDYGTIGETSFDKAINATVITTKAGILKKASDCVLLPGKLVDDPDAKWNNPAIRALAPAQGRLFVSGGQESSENGYEERPLPENFPELNAYVETPFK